MPGTPDLLRKSGSASVYHKISAATTNADTVKAAPGVVTGYYLVNTNAAFRYVKLYNLAANPTVGTDVPRLTLGIPAASAANINLDPPLAFETGIAIAMTTGIADADSAAVAASDIAANVYYQ